MLKEFYLAEHHATPLLRVIAVFLLDYLFNIPLQVVVNRTQNLQCKANNKRFIFKFKRPHNEGVNSARTHFNMESNNFIDLCRNL